MLKYKSCRLISPKFIIMPFCCRCPECVALSSVWHDLAQKFNNNNNSELGIAKADCSLQTQLCRGKGRLVVLTEFIINI